MTLLAQFFALNLLSMLHQDRSQHGLVLGRTVNKLSPDALAVIVHHSKTVRRLHPQLLLDLERTSNGITLAATGAHGIEE